MERERDRNRKQKKRDRKRDREIIDINRRRGRGEMEVCQHYWVFSQGPAIWERVRKGGVGWGWGKCLGMGKAELSVEERKAKREGEEQKKNTKAAVMWSVNHGTRGFIFVLGFRWNAALCMTESSNPGSDSPWTPLPPWSPIPHVYCLPLSLPTNLSAYQSVYLSVSMKEKQSSDMSLTYYVK